MKTTDVKKGYIVVIGNDITDVVRYAECKPIGLYTGFLVTKKIDDRTILIHGYDKIVSVDNVYLSFECVSYYIEWAKNELNEMIEDKTLMYTKEELINMIER